MCRKLTLKRDQQGSSLVIAIFILVVMLLLGVALTRVLSTSAETVAYEVIGLRAFQAANIGVQQKLADIFPLSGETFQCDGSTNITDTAAIFPSENHRVPAILSSLNNVDGLNNCVVEKMVCENFKVDDVVYYRVESTGQCNVGDETVSREVVVEARSL